MGVVTMAGATAIASPPMAMTTRAVVRGFSATQLATLVTVVLTQRHALVKAVLMVRELPIEVLRLKKGGLGWLLEWRRAESS
jgi:3-polyprenyl-4-hydroxybenzoate decarboxylase